MDNITKQLQKATAHLRIAEDDKALMREHLVLYMEHKPMRDVVRTRRNTSQAFPLWSFFRGQHLSGALAIALIVTTTTFSVSSAASEALPGDLLYPVKVDINEEIKTVFITSDEARVAWERERAEMRLEEAGKLASEGRLDTSAQEEVARRFTEHTDSVVAQVRKVEESDPVLAAEMSGDFEESLGTHEVVLARLIVEQDEEVADSARDLVKQVYAAASVVQEVREDAEAEIIRVEAQEVANSVQELASTEGGISSNEGSEASGDLPVEEGGEGLGTESANLHVRAAHRAQERAQVELERAQELVTLLTDTSELKKPAQDEIDSAKVRMEEGAIALDLHDLGGAYVAYRNATVRLQKVAQLVAVADLFDVEVSTGMLSQGTDSGLGTSSDVVSPKQGDADVVPNITADAGATEELRMRAEGSIQETRVRLLSVDSDAELATKVNGMIKDASANMLRGEIYITLGEYADAQKLFNEAHAYMTSARALLSDIESDYRDDEIPVTNEVAPVTSTQGTAGEGVVNPVLSDLVVRHVYAEGVHTYSTEFIASTSCTQASGTLRVAESYPEQVTFELTTHVTTGNGACSAVLGTQQVVATTSASAEALFAGVTVDGRQVAWTLVGSEDSFGGQAVTGSTTEKDQSNFLRRAYDNAEEWVMGE